MQRQQSGQLTYYTFDSLDLPHGIFTRAGGSSAGQWSSLNVGGSVGDDPDHVRANRESMRNALKLDYAQVRTTWQVHEATVIVGDEQPQNFDDPPRADAIITQNEGIGLEQRYADCVPILLHDPVRKAIGLAHAGWRGTVAHVGPATVNAMSRQFGSRPSDIWAGIGPSICAEHYTVGGEVIDAIRGAFGDSAGLLSQDAQGKTHLDLWAANAVALQRTGVGHVEIGGLCTACNTDDFFSHRAEAGRTGRFGALLSL